MKKNKSIILVCTSDQPKQAGEKGCLSKESREVLALFQQKKELEAEDESLIRVKESICMNNCANAICVRIFPGNSLYEHIQLSDVEELWESHIQKNQEVKHLLAPKINRFMGF